MPPMHSITSISVGIRLISRMTCVNSVSTAGLFTVSGSEVADLAVSHGFIPAPHSLIQATRVNTTKTSTCRNASSTKPYSVIASSRHVTASSHVRHMSTVPSGKIIPFNLPDIGEGIAEVEVLKWFVEEGAVVAQFDKLLEVQSDKATVDITSRYDGTIRKIHYKVGEMAKTGKPLLDIELAPTTTTSLPSQAAAAAAAPEVNQSGASPITSSSSSSSTTTTTKGLAAPAVRHLARQHNLVVGDMAGTGKDGRVTKEDILKVIQNNQQPMTPSMSSSSGSGSSASSGATMPPITTTTTTTPKPSATLSSSSSSSSTHASHLQPSYTHSIPPDTRQPIRGLQRIMVKSMTQAWDVPHFGYCDEILMDNLMGARNSLKPIFTTAQGVKLTFLPFLLKAASLALTQFPVLNAQVSSDGQDLIFKGSHNIGVAMDTPRGLIVPNIKAVQSRSLLEIAVELQRLQQLASSGKLGEADLSETTFSLSNIGTIGGTYASPIIPSPNVAIGALGRVSKVPRYASTLGMVGGGGGSSSGGMISNNKSEDVLVPVHVMPVSWAADHRVVDGATMARFSNAWKAYVENPVTMLAQLK